MSDLCRQKGFAPSKLLVDTNVWLDYYLGLRRNSAVAGSFVRAALERGATLLYAVQSLRDVYLQTGQFYKKLFRQERGDLTQAAAVTIRQAAWSHCENMSNLATAVGADESDVWLAKKHHAIHPDLEDDFVIAASLRSEADYLVTNDATLRRDAPVRAISPEELLTLWRAMDGDMTRGARP